MLIEHALKYANYGWHVFPIRGKRPLVEWRDASTADPEQVRALFESHPDATGIGLDCGKSSLVVIDVDDWDGFSDLTARLDAIPPTATTTTGGGGMHLLFHASDVRVRNSASKLAKGVDVRGDGGYIVLPPSAHDSGDVYAWSSRTAPAPLPGDLLRMLTPPPPSAPVVTSTAGQDRWGEQVLAAEVGRMAMASEGTRNQTLYEAALKVLSAVKGGHIDRTRAEQALLTAGMQAGLDEHESHRTIRSADGDAIVRHPQANSRLAPTAPLPPLDAGANDELLTIGQLQQMKQAPWLLGGKIPAGFTVLYGPPAVGKTFVAVDWCLTLAATQDRPVLYLPGEGLSGLGARMTAWMKHHPEHAPGDKIIVSRQLPPLSTTEGVTQLARWVEQKEPALVVLDTWARALGGAEENSASETGAAIAVMDRLRATYDTSTLVLHHPGKHNAGVERGSGALRGAADAMWTVQRDPANVMELIVSCSKMKDHEEPGPYRYLMEPDRDLGSVWLRSPGGIR